MSKPRNSLLRLFDPLASPRRNAPSPDSDKENSSFSFFGFPNHPCPVKLTHRLVDVGDITVQENSIHLLLDDDDQNLPFNNDENNSATPRSTNILSPNPRTPLIELPIEREITPLARSKTYKRSPLLPSDQPHVISPSHNILSVINEVNSSGTSFASPSPRSRVLPLPRYSNDSTEDILPNDPVAPQILVTLADSLRNSVVTLNLETPPGPLLTDATHPFESTPPSPTSEDSSLPLPTLRHILPNTSSHDANRHSIDLHHSFQLHLQSEETSFDLLNDRVSFFATGSDAESFFGDDSFDMATEEHNMEKALEKIKAEEKVVKGKTPSPAKQSSPAVHRDSPVAIQGHLNPPLESKKVSFDAASPGSARKFFPKRLSLPSTPSPKMTLPETVSPASPDSPSAIPVSVAPPPRVEPKLPRLSLYTPRPSVRGASSKPPPAVPALKIVKRAKRFDHEKSSSSGSARSSVSSVPEPVELPAAAAASLALTGQRFGSVPSTTDLQIGKESSSTSFGAARVAGQGQASAPAITLIRQTGTGPRRVPITKGQASTVYGTGVSRTQRTPPAVRINGPKRVPIVAATKVSATVPTQVKAPAACGLKPLARGGGGSTSALPRLVGAGHSRLPSSSSSKMKAVGMDDANGNIGGRSLGVRRIMFGGK